MGIWFMIYDEADCDLFIESLYKTKTLYCQYGVSVDILWNKVSINGISVNYAWTELWKGIKSYCKLFSADSICKYICNNEKKKLNMLVIKKYFTLCSNKKY